MSPSHDIVTLGTNLALIDQMYAEYARDPASVDAGWRELFSNGHTEVDIAPYRAEAPGPEVALPTLWPLVNAYRVRGHLAAHLDPLDMLERPGHQELEPALYGFSEADEKRVFSTGGLFGPERATLGEVVEHLRRAYCGSIGLEYMHISTPSKKAWLARRMEELPGLPAPAPQVRLSMLEQLVAAATFEHFIHTKFPGTKRFSLEGSESLVPLIEEVLEHAGRFGAFEVVIGMAHRGRLNILTQTLQRQARDLFSEFQDIQPEATLGGGDVKYHLGYSCDRTDRSGHTLHVSLAYNPSHLEAVDPVVCGRVRAKQRRHGDWERARSLGVIVHGDAAFAGQGLVAETLQLSNLHGYRTGGTVHVIVNNQIGFTASPTESRSTPYCTDVAKMIQCPIWHVNGEDLDAVARVVEMAMEYRSQFKSDVVIDMFCYRKYGHNEMDEPSFTQPLMYEQIQGKQAVDQLYADKLIGEGVIDHAGVDAIRLRYSDLYEQELAAARVAEKRPVIPMLGGVWRGYVGGKESDVRDVETGVSRERLAEITEHMTTLPADFHAHPKIRRLFEQRREMGSGARPLDWGMAEMLAYGSLLREETLVRLSGQDTSRGTFSHRHAIITDIENGTEYMPLSNLHPDQGECRIYDSPLSEAGVLGFEFGYSLDYPDGLIIWEAQFGDFANGAQVIIDQFLTSSEDKWNRLSGLVMFLPHGYEGQGPEHSSARFERLLQQAAEDNIQVVQPSTPAQMFHLLRRQVRRNWRKPLFVLTPKSLLRLPEATSRLEELTAGRFQRVLADTQADPARVERILVCSGRVYYDVAAERAKRKDETAAIIRIEQLYPWRPEEVERAFAPFQRAREVVWVQDEPANMGAQQWLRPHLAELAGDRKLRMVSREESASPATGSSKAHAIEQKRLLEEAFRPA